MTQEQALKILKDLQYRIDVSNPADPEYANAVSLRDRLCKKYNIDPATIQAKQILTRVFECATREEAQVVIQYAFVKLQRKQNEFNLCSFKNSRYAKKRFAIEIPMDEDEYNQHKDIIRDLVLLFRRRRDEYRRKILAEMSKRLKAWDYQFLDAGNLLGKADPTTKKHKAPPWGLREAMAAASDLDGTIFPESYLAQQQKALSHAG